jgi:hypothetical protein
MHLRTPSNCFATTAIPSQDPAQLLANWCNRASDKGVSRPSGVSRFKKSQKILDNSYGRRRVIAKPGHRPVSVFCNSLNNRLSGAS